MPEEKEPHSTTASTGPGSDSAESVSVIPATATSPALETEYYLTGSKLYLVLLGVGLAIFLFALDVSVISTVWPLSSNYVHTDS